MRHGDDDLSPFRDEPVFQALTGPATEAELAGEADAVAAFREAAPERPKRRSAARVAAGSSAAIVTLALSGGVAAAYTAELPTSWQNTLHKHLHALDIPAKKSKPSPPAALPSAAPPVVVPDTTPTPRAVVTHPASPKPHATPTAVPSTPVVSPSASSSVPVVVTTPPSSPAATPAATQPATPAAASGLTMTVSPGTHVTVGTELTVNGQLRAADGSPVAGHRIVLAEHLVGERGWHRVGGPLETSASGQVTFSVPAVQHNLRLVLRAGKHVHSTPQQVVVIPIINVRVAPTSSGAQSTTVTVSVEGGEPGDVVTIRRLGTGSGVQGTLDGSLTATFTVPVSQQRVIHYRAFVPRTKAHGAHALAFYVPPSGSG
jgi:hypothetical protein